MLSSIPIDLKTTYLIAFAIVLIFAFILIIVIVIYNKKQLVFRQEKIIHEQTKINEKLEKELQIQKSLQEERNRISGDMHDELGAGISAIKLQSEILKQQINKNALNNNDVEEIIRISDEMKTSMREMLWSLNSKNDVLYKFVLHCKTYVENYFSKTQIKLVFVANIPDDEITISSDVRRAILLVIKEACHNIIKHSNATEATVELSHSENILKIIISDNGIGFNISKNSDGYGISTMQSRISSIDGEISIKSDSSGTQIIITVNTE
jgi:two-component system sensor histidine kinase DesK